MKILYIHSDKITKMDIVWGLLEAGYDVDVLHDTVKLDEITEEDLERVEKAIAEIDLVVTQNFVPVVAKACKNKQVRYASWIYDSPQYHLYTKEALYDTNYVFAFDKMQVKRLKEIGVLHVYYLPLAANVTKASQVEITEEDLRAYSSDVSFIGSLYKKTMFRNLMPSLPREMAQEVNAACDRLFFRWGPNYSVYDSLSESCANFMGSHIGADELAKYNMSPVYGAETLTMCYELAYRERTALLAESAKRFKTVFHTKAPEECDFCENIIVRDPVYEEELYKVYYASKINLNITMRSIETGIPLRVFDIMAVGGCVFTNWQEEVGELFNIDKDIVVYSDMEEYLEKAAFYLSHDELRERIGINGYLRVKNEYNNKVACQKLVETVMGNG